MKPTDVRFILALAFAFADGIRCVAQPGDPLALADPLGGYGYLEGTGSAARFSLPAGVAVDRAGNVHVADHGNHAIRKITPVGLVSTLAGLAGSAGSDDGTGADARFAFHQTLRFEPLQGFRDGQEAHAKLRRQLTA